MVEATRGGMEGGGDQSAAASTPAAVCSLMRSSANALPPTSAISGMGGVLASDASTHRHRLGTVKLCRKWCWVELIKGWESLGGWGPVQSGARRRLKADTGLRGLEGRRAPQAVCAHGVRSTAARAQEAAWGHVTDAWCDERALMETYCMSKSQITFNHRESSVLFYVCRTNWTKSYIHTPPPPSLLQQKTI